MATIKFKKYTLTSQIANLWLNSWRLIVEIRISLPNVKYNLKPENISEFESVILIYEDAIGKYQ